MFSTNSLTSGPPFYAAFEEGAATAKGFFDDVGRKPGPWIYADIVRWWVVDSLKKQGFDAEEEETSAARLTALPNNGVLIRHKGYVVRACKALPSGKAPGPGPSTAKQQFYQQRLPIFAGSPAEVRNLLVVRAVTVIDGALITESDGRGRSCVGLRACA